MPTIAENEELRVDLDETLTVHHKATRVTWTADPVSPQLNPWENRVYYDTPAQAMQCRLRWTERRAKPWRVEIVNRLGQVLGTFDVKIALDGPDLAFRVSNFRSERLLCLVFPPTFSQKELVLPIVQGCILREPFHPYLRYACTYRNEDLSMRWFGGTAGAASWMAFMETPWDSGIFIHHTKLGASPVWEMTHGKWGYPREVRYRFLAGNYVDMCREYRAYAERQGMVKTLREKIDENPEVEKLLGARMIKVWMLSHFKREFLEKRPEFAFPGLPKRGELEVLWNTYADVERMVRKMKKMGVERAMLVLCGWGKRGYDNLHPDIFPPSRKLGTQTQLRKLFTESPYLMGLHDNFNDIYEDSPSFPQGVRKLADGSLFKGKLWDGGLAYLLCSEWGYRYAVRNTPDIKKTGADAYFIDVTTAAPLFECFDPEHPVTRAREMENRVRLMKHFVDEGFVSGNEAGTDWAVPHVHFLEGMMEEPFRVARDFPYTRVPLWNMVFHDSVVAYWYQKDSYAQEWRHKVPYDALYGNPTFWRFGREFNRCRDEFEATIRVDELARRVALDRLTHHEFLDDDEALQRSEFSGGTSVVANMSDEAREYEGRKVAPWDYLELT